MLTLMGLRKRRVEKETAEHIDWVNFLIRYCDGDILDYDDVVSHLERHRKTETEFDQDVRLLTARRELAAKVDRVECAAEESKKAEFEIRTLQDEFLRFRTEIEDKISVFVGAKFVADQEIIAAESAKARLLETGRCPEILAKIDAVRAEKSQACDKLNSLKNGRRLAEESLGQQNVILRNYLANRYLPFGEKLDGESFEPEYRANLKSAQKRFDEMTVELAECEHRLKKLNREEELIREEFLNPSAI